MCHGLIDPIPILECIAVFPVVLYVCTGLPFRSASFRYLDIGPLSNFQSIASVRSPIVVCPSPAPVLPLSCIAIVLITSAIPIDARHSSGIYKDDLLSRCFCYFTSSSALCFFTIPSACWLLWFSLCSAVQLFLTSDSLCSRRCVCHNGSSFLSLFCFLSFCRT